MQDLPPNYDLQEITDPKIVEEIRTQLNIGEQDLDGNDTPFICGTIVNGGFSRKLKMVGGVMYSLLGISQSSHFVETDKQSQDLKNSIKSYCEQASQNP